MVKRAPIAGAFILPIGLYKKFKPIYSMKRSQFVPNILFRIPNNPSVFRYERNGKTDTVRQIGFGKFRYHQELYIVNLFITRTTICFYTGYSTGCVLMYSDKIHLKDLELVNSDSLLPQPNIHENQPLP